MSKQQEYVKKSEMYYKMRKIGAMDLIGKHHLCYEI